MHIAIHQPNFLPWLGYFYKIAQCDVFVFLDHVEYTKKSYTKRVKIHKGKLHYEDLYLSIPLKNHSDFTPINKLQIANHIEWQKKMYAQIYSTYHKAPYFKQILPLMETYFKIPSAFDFLSEFNISIIKSIAQLLDLHPTWVISSELPETFKGKNLNVDIVRSLQGSTYISGQGAKKYQNEALFEQQAIELKYSNFQKKFQALDVPNHFYNKSILSYLACFDKEEIKAFIQ